MPTCIQDYNDMDNLHFELANSALAYMREIERKKEEREGYSVLVSINE
jgi:hypothetical protein